MQRGLSILYGGFIVVSKEAVSHKDRLSTPRGSEQTSPFLQIFNPVPLKIWLYISRVQSIFLQSFFFPRRQIYSEQTRDSLILQKNTLNSRCRTLQPSQRRFTTLGCGYSMLFVPARSQS